MNKVVIVNIDDWACLYVNGEEKLQNHSIDIRDIISYTPIESIEIIWADGTPLEEFAMNDGYLPRTLEEVQKMLKGE